jgi:molecular chaperone GrpE
MAKKSDSHESAAPQSAVEASGKAAQAQDQAAAGPVSGPADAAPAAGAAVPEPPEQPRDPAEGLREEVKALQDKYLRLLAEFDNYKRRTLRDHQRLVESANADLMLDLTEVRECLERALKTCADAPSAGAVLEGVRLIYTKLDEALGRHGLEPFAAEGDEFDPELHDAMMRAPHAEVAEGRVARVVECGYRLRGQVLKHARVIVSAGAPAQPAAQEQAAQPSDNKE